MTDRMTRNLTKLLIPILGLAIVAYPMLAAAAWVMYAPSNAGAEPAIPPGAEFSAPILILGGALAFLVGSLQSFGLCGVRMTLKETLAGRPLSGLAVEGLRRFAWVQLLMVFATVVQRTLSVLIVTAMQPVGEAALAISFGSHQVGRLFLALVLLVAVNAMAKGRAAAEENESFL